MRHFVKQSFFILSLLVILFPVNAKLSEEEFSELLVAVEASDYKKIRKIINKEKANAKDKHGRPLLHRIRDIRIARLFLENGCDVNATEGDYGPTALHKVSNVDFARLFIQFGAAVNSKSQHGFTPLHEAESVQLTRLLVENGADINAKTDFGQTPLHWSHNAAKATFLIDQGADINAKDNDGRSPLLLTRDIRVLKVLIEKGANINAQNNAGATALHLSAEDGKILHGDKMVNGHHPPPEIDWAPNREIIKLLIKHGANVSLKNNKGQTAFDVARDKKIKMLLKAAEGKHQIDEK